MMSLKRLVGVHAVAATVGGGVLFFGFMLPAIFSIGGAHDVLSLVKLFAVIVIVTFVISAPFTLIFWLTYNVGHEFTRSHAALVGAGIAFASYLLLFLLAGEKPKASGDYLLSIGILLAAGAVGGLSFRWLLYAVNNRRAGDT
jgi:hypothetical protein